MRSARFNDLLAGTAVAFALALGPAGVGTALAAAEPAPATTASVPENAAAPAAAKDDAAPAAATPATESQSKPEPAATAPATTPAAAKPAAATQPEPTQPEPIQPAATAAQPAATTPAAAASEPAQPAAAAAATPATPPSADAALADRIRDQFQTGKFDRILGGKKERAAVEAFYAARQFAPLWVTDGAMNARAKAVAAYLGGVAADGLEPADYPIPDLKAGPEALAEAEMRLTDTVLTYARHAEGGRVHYSRVSSDIEYTLSRPEPAQVLAKLADTKDTAAALDSFEPPHAAYKALKAKLAEARAKIDANEKEEAVVRVPEGKLLRLGMEDDRVPLLRKRLKVTQDPDSRRYDEAVAGAVKAFQQGAGLTADGLLGANTLKRINGGTAHSRTNVIDTIVANMERWRWVPRNLGTTYVMVNIPDYTLRVMHDGKQVWKTNIVVGKPNLPTPLISAEMKYITVNPTWNVPPSIIQNEYLPALQQDPQAMERIGLKVEQRPDGTIRIYQPPGDRNALGRIRFNFPNKFLVYQHDTPDKNLFAHSKRAYSHGCMRVEDPLKYGEVLLGLALPNEHYTAERLRKMFGGSEININFPHTIPVHLTYQTAFVDDAGNLQLRDDVYGRDARLLAIMKGSDRKVADIAVERPRGSSAAPVKMPPGTFGGSQPAGGFFSGPSFFERLFGGGVSEQQPAPRPRNGMRQSAR
ncbi:MAG TPA: L,D-transpeptidase family protein [Xanthobacteraceae bacterium]|nr:L,D-transpeptidase family protein [Xanthobacteraceae bacterium]